MEIAEERLCWVRKLAIPKLMQGTIGYWQANPEQYQLIDGTAQWIVRQARIYRQANMAHIHDGNCLDEDGHCEEVE